MKRKNEKIDDLTNDKNPKDERLESFSIGKLTSFEKIQNMKVSYEQNSKIFVYKSDVNGTGKTFAIKEDIKRDGNIYIYFPFGGYLNKKLVYEKIKNLLEKIEEIKDKGRISIHLDLHETQEKGIMNDFLFSFLFTKYYKNDENVIYIPREMKIYIEIENCFLNFTESFPILNIFQNNQLIKINLNDPRPLQLSGNEKQIFSLLGLQTLDEITNYINDKIGKVGINNPSYYQKRQFINSFLSQITINNYRKIKHLLDKRIDSTKYFLENSYSDLLKQTNEELGIKDESQIIEKLTDIEIKKYDDKIPLIFKGKFF